MTRITYFLIIMASVSFQITFLSVFVSQLRRVKLLHVKEIAGIDAGHRWWPQDNMELQKADPQYVYLTLLM